MNKILLVVAAGLFSLGAYAQEAGERPAKASEETTGEQARQTVEREVAEEDESETDLDTFNPSEKINVDSSVSFPVDI